MKQAEMIERAKKMTMEELENAKFFTNMVDRWGNEDYIWYGVLTNEIKARKTNK